MCTHNEREDKNKEKVKERCIVITPIAVHHIYNLFSLANFANKSIKVFFWVLLYCTVLSLFLSKVLKILLSPAQSCRTIGWRSGAWCRRRSLRAAAPRCPRRRRRRRRPRPDTRCTARAISGPCSCGCSRLKHKSKLFKSSAGKKSTSKRKKPKHNNLFSNRCLNRKTKNTMKKE